MFTPSVSFGATTTGRGETQTHKRHAKLESSVSRERHNKCYTREKGVWSGVGGGPKEED